MPLLGLPSLLFVLVIVLLLFGKSQLGGLGKGLGQGIHNFRKSLRGDDPPPPSNRNVDRQDPPKS
jgi:sec-independent protein translocase protein TatA